jgi:hypothetical protein
MGSLEENIYIMQRLHEDDLVGHVLEQEHWDLVSFPAIAERNEEHAVETVFGPRQEIGRQSGRSQYRPHDL